MFGRTTCPICQTPTTAAFVSIAPVPIHCNVLWASHEAARSAPRGDIDLHHCTRCGHVFNASFDPARTTYGGAYENSLHHSPTFQDYARTLVDDLVERHDLRHKDIVEIGAGQGDFLHQLCTVGGNRGTGFDPSHVGSSSCDDVRLVPAFFDETFADQPADLVVCRHVLEHIDASGDFVAMVRRVIGERSTPFFVEVPDARWMLRHGGVWDVIYEHCGYFTPESLAYVLTANHFEVERITGVFGGQFLTAEARPAGHGAAAGATDTSELVADVERFADVVEESVTGWGARFAAMAAEGRRAAIWGTGSKGVTFLNLVDTHGVVTLAVDLNPRKQGMFVAGTGQPIVAPEQLAATDVDLLVVMNPNYADEIARHAAQLGLTSDVVPV